MRPGYYITFNIDTDSHVSLWKVWKEGILLFTAQSRIEAEEWLDAQEDQ